MKIRFPFPLLLALTLILSACNPKQATPPTVDTNLVTAAPISNYDGTQADLDAVADQLNTRPRQTLGWKTPTEMYAIATGVALTN